ncbi:FMN-dependent NADH-azoreductase [Pokkaliibacter sp. MBI-7]|uniref:FMN-dependent NADH-azoreductase n=1 Tax=Pokkaliibacter sp. MBI-7 TaxID=3040600 RepID=UPI00244C5EAF|nr:FMN-dependent NADH-azoreductase [Pokkaliibacter sp. MBI-7]MDH2436542.1 FMN-dependent NADH-azoreductase [Pokkaliibacter sp. MBI-7]
MAKVLALYNSLMGDNGNSTQLVNLFLQKYQAQNAGSSVTKRDLVAEALPHLTLAEMGAWMTPADQRTAEQQEVAALSDNLIKEVQDSDVIVIGMPLYNFGISSQFKAWVDRIARAGVTFKYTETGPVGLITGKKVYVLAARGGMYQGTSADSQTPYLQTTLGFLGMTDVEFVYAEGLAMGDESKSKALSAADSAISELA